MVIMTAAGLLHQLLIVGVHCICTIPVLLFCKEVKDPLMPFGRIWWVITVDS